MCYNQRWEFTAVSVCACKRKLALEQVFVSAFPSFQCVSKSVCHLSLALCFLSVFVFTCSSYLMWLHGRSKSHHAKGFVKSIWRTNRCFNLAWPAQPDSDKDGKERFVKCFIVKYTDKAATSPVLSDHSGKDSVLIAAGCNGYGFIYLQILSCSFVCKFVFYLIIATEYSPRAVPPSWIGNMDLLPHIFYILFI